jgi:hypothetical protein
MIALAEPQTYSLLGKEFVLNPGAVRVLMVTDAIPEEPHEHYIYADPTTVSWQNTCKIFADAGVSIHSYQDLLDRGILMDPCLDLIRPGRISPWHVRYGAVRIGEWLNRLPQLRAIALMGDVPIRCFNEMTRPRWASARRLAPGDASYRMQGNRFFLGRIEVFPTYLHTAASFGLERTKQRALAEDMHRLVRYLQ